MNMNSTLAAPFEVRYETNLPVGPYAEGTLMAGGKLYCDPKMKVADAMRVIEKTLRESMQIHGGMASNMKVTYTVYEAKYKGGYLDSGKSLEEYGIQAGESITFGVNQNVAPQCCVIA